MSIQTSFTDIEFWRGSQPNALQSGRVDVYIDSSQKTGYTVSTNNDKTGYTVSTVSDKTGYSLTAASYVIVASIQRGNTSVSNGNTTANGTISAVTTGKANLNINGTSAGNGDVRATINSTTNILFTRTGSSGDAITEWEVSQWV